MERKKPIQLMVPSLSQMLQPCDTDVQENIAVDVADATVAHSVGAPGVVVAYVVPVGHPWLTCP